MAGEATAAGAATGSLISPGFGTVIGAGLGLIGDLFGGFSSSKESEENRREASRQFDVQMNESVQRRVKDALKAGINPLTALGYNGGASPTIHAGGGSDAGSFASRAGDRLHHMMERLTEEKAVDDMNYDSQAKELDLEGKRLENDILRARRDALTTNSPGSDMNTVPDRAPVDSLLFRPSYDMQGRPRLVINQDVMEGDSDNPGYLSTIGSMYLSGDIDHVTGKLSKSAAEKVRWLYHESTGRDIWNWEDMYISPSEAAAAAAMFSRGVS